jgi:hypothetical protein
VSGMTKQGLVARLADVIRGTLHRIRRARPEARGRVESPQSRQSPQSLTDVRGPTYPGDFEGTPKISYRPNPRNGRVADPGEVVWTWVPFEEDHGQGKDRPVLVIGRDGPWLLALQMTSKDHDHDGPARTRAGRRWVDIGSGRWDSLGRDSEVRVDRVLRVDPAHVRRIGAVLAKARFDQVASAVRRPAP